MGNKLRSPTQIGHLLLSDSSIDDYLYVQGIPIKGLNIENGTGTGSLVQKPTTYEIILNENVPYMVRYVENVLHYTAPPTSSTVAKATLVAMGFTDSQANALISAVGYANSVAVGILIGSGFYTQTEAATYITTNGNSSTVVSTALVEGQLKEYGIEPTTDLSNKAKSSNSFAMGGNSTVNSPGGVAFGIGNIVGDENAPVDGITSIAAGIRNYNKGRAAIVAGIDLKNYASTSAMFGGGKQEYKIDGETDVDKANQHLYLNNLAEAGGDVEGSGDNRVGVIGVNKGSNSLIAGYGQWNGAINSTIFGNQNIIGENKNNINGGPCANNFIGNGVINFIDKSESCAELGARNNIQNSNHVNLFGYQLVANGRREKTAIGRYNSDKDNTIFEVGNGTSDTDRKNAFEVLSDGRAKVQSAPVDNDDVVRKADLANVAGGKIYMHNITIKIQDSTSNGVVVITLYFIRSTNDIINTLSKIVEKPYQGFIGDLSTGATGAIQHIIYMPANNTLFVRIDGTGYTNNNISTDLESITDNVIEL